MGKTGKLKMLRDVSLVKSPFLTALQAGIKWPMSFFRSNLSNNILSESAFYTELKVCRDSGPQLSGAFWVPTSDFKPSIHTQLVIENPRHHYLPETEILQSNNKKTIGLDKYCLQDLRNTG